MSTEYYLSLKDVERNRYKEKISKQEFSNEVDPYEISHGWVDDISLWPSVEYGNIYNYLIKTIFNGRIRRSLEAYNYYIK